MMPEKKKKTKFCKRYAYVRCFMQHGSLTTNCCKHFRKLPHVVYDALLLLMLLLLLLLLLLLQLLKRSSYNIALNATLVDFFCCCLVPIMRLCPTATCATACQLGGCKLALLVPHYFACLMSCHKIYCYQLTQSSTGTGKATTATTTTTTTATMKSENANDCYI